MADTDVEPADSEVEAATSEYEPGREPVSSDKKFEVLAHEADGFYRTVITVATTFLGGSILFLEKLAPHPIPWTLFFLGIGWVALLVAIFAIVDVRRQNLKSLWHAMDGKYDDASAVDVRTRAGSTLAQWAMVAGMTLVAAYGFANLLARKDEPVPTQRVILTSDEKVPLSIPAGSTGPQAVPTPTPTPTAVPSPPPHTDGKSGSGSSKR